MTKNAADQFERKCAYSLSEGDAHTEGKEEYKLEHGGKVYFFSSKEKKAKFQENLNENIEKAKTNWISFRGQ